jgi:hypothetical protein
MLPPRIILTRIRIESSPRPTINNSLEPIVDAGAGRPNIIPECRSLPERIREALKRQRVIIRRDIRVIESSHASAHIARYPTRRCMRYYRIPLHVSIIRGVDGRHKGAVFKGRRYNGPGLLVLEGGELLLGGFARGYGGVVVRVCFVGGVVVGDGEADEARGYAVGEGVEEGRDCYGEVDVVDDAFAEGFGGFFEELHGGCYFVFAGAESEGLGMLVGFGLEGEGLGSTLRRNMAAERVLK